MTNYYESAIRRYHQLNACAVPGGIVLLGSSFSKNIPLNELRQDFEIDLPLYNRSVDELSLFDLGAVVKECAIDLTPKKLLLQLGETDLQNDAKGIDEILCRYENEIQALRAKLTGCHITLISVCETDSLFSSVDPHKNNHMKMRICQFNTGLKELAARTGCAYADISGVLNNAAPEIKAFYLLRRFFLDGSGDCRTLHALYA